MTDKTQEALKLALEALELHGQQYPHMVKGYCLDAITAIREALAEQPAQQEPVIGETNVELDFYSDDAINGQQRKLAGKVEMGQPLGNRTHESASNPDAEREIAVITGVDEYGPMLGWFKHWINYPVGTKLYTSPPANKPLTDEEIDNLPWGPHEGNPMTFAEGLRDFARAIEAKLKEKNHG